MTKVGVVLSGCGVYDGAEIHESVITMLALAKAGAEYQCLAPDKEQMHVINHVTGQPAEGESRNVLVEAARIARGDIIPLHEANANDLDALILPGGFGAAKNLSNYATAGAGMEVDQDLVTLVRTVREQNKPVGFVCIAPVIAAKLIPDASITIGCDEATASDIQTMGGTHISKEVNEVVVDEANNIVSTPAYMLGPGIADVANGIEALVDAVLQRAK